jgi:DNA-binding LacI/PurR family transcriptional regulator
MKAITLYDVALLAGVSYQTVSRVINDAEHVSARTREKVQQAMAELHYVPNLRAQQLAGNAPVRWDSSPPIWPCTRLRKLCRR